MSTFFTTVVPGTCYPVCVLMGSPYLKTDIHGGCLGHSDLLLFNDPLKAVTLERFRYLLWQCIYRLGPLSDVHVMFLYFSC